MSQSEVRRGRTHDAELTAAFHGEVAPVRPIEHVAPSQVEAEEKTKKKRGFWSTLADIFRF